MYWATGCLHGPHHIMKEWADKYAGKFDDGWDAYRERVFAPRQGEGLDSAGRAADPARSAACRRGTTSPRSERPFQRRLMEVAAGFAEHADVQVGRLVDEIERLGYGDNTLIFYIWGDNGSSGEGQNGTISELLAQNGIPTHRRRCTSQALDEIGGLDVARLAEGRQPVPRRLGVGRQHALQGHEAAGLAPRRHAQPDGRALAGEDRARPDPAHPVPPLQRRRADDLRGGRHHPAARRQRRPAGPDRRRQLRLHLRRPDAPRAGCAPSTSRSWAAARSTTTAGWPPRSARGCPGSPACPRASASGPPTTTTWELYNLDEDWSQANDLAAADARQAGADEGDCSPIEAARNSVYPIGGGLWIPIFHPELRISPPYTRVELHRRHHPHARVLRARARQPRQPRHHRRRHPRATPTACSTRSAAPAAASPATSTTASSATSTTSSSSCAPRSAASSAAAGRHGQDRGRDRATPRPGPAARSNITITRQRRTVVAERHGPDQRPAAVHRQRLPRHRHLPRRPRVAGLLRPSAVPVQRHHPQRQRPLCLLARDVRRRRGRGGLENAEADAVRAGRGGS